MPDAWPIAKAQAALGQAALHLLAVLEALEVAKAALPRPADLDARLEHRKPYDVATDLLGTIECVIDDCLRPAIRTLERSARATDAELEQQYREWLKREGRR